MIYNRLEINFVPDNYLRDLFRLVLRKFNYIYDVINFFSGTVTINYPTEKRL